MRDPGAELCDAGRVAAGVGVPGVHGLREAGSRAEPGSAVGPVREPAQLRELDHVGPVDVHAVLSVLLRPVEGAVREADQVVPVERLVREPCDAGAGRHGADVSQFERADASKDGRCGRESLFGGHAGKEQRELVAAEAEGLAVLAEAPADAGEHTVADRVSVEVVDPLEVVHVDQAERERLIVGLGAEQLVLQPLLEAAVVAEPAQRVGQREPHRAQRLVGGALVERDREQRADQCGGEHRRALPEHDEHEGGGPHESEWNRGRASRRDDQLGERPAGRDCDRGRDQDEVERVLRGRRDRDLRDDRGGSRSVHEGDEQGRGARSEREHRRVEGDALERPVLEELDDGGSGQGNQHAGFPAEEDDAARAEDERQRDAAALGALDRHRITACERGGEEERERPGDFGEVVRGQHERDRGSGGYGKSGDPDGCYEKEDARRQTSHVVFAATSSSCIR